MAQAVRNTRLSNRRTSRRTPALAYSSRTIRYTSRWAAFAAGDTPAGIGRASCRARTLCCTTERARRPSALDRANTFFTLTGLLMVGWLGFRLVTDLLHARSVVQHSVLARQLARPIPAGVSPAAKAAQRDVYLIVLDEYANAGVLRDVLLFDNRVFEDSLRHLGFTIPGSVHSNYVHTLLSLPSLLNFSHLTPLTDEVGRHSTDATLPNYLLENNRAVAFFKRQGYRFLFFPSQWWPSTVRNRNADWQFDAWPGFNPARAATRSDLRRSLLATTAFAFLKRDDHWDADYIRRTLSRLEQVPTQTEPTFTFAHVVSPHWPTSSGRTVRYPGRRRLTVGSGEDRRTPGNCSV